jgi:hypothetical protein
MSHEKYISRSELIGTRSFQQKWICQKASSEIVWSKH